MKDLVKHKILQYAKQLFRRRQRDYVPVYLSRFETIDKLIESGLLAIDLCRRYVCLDTSLHIQYMNSKEKYVRFFDNLRVYINYRLGMEGQSMLNPEDRLNFGVMLKQTILYNADTGEVYDIPKIEYHTLIVGINQNGMVEYDTYDEKNS